MKCHVCGAALVPVTTDLPFKLSDTTIVIVKALPVLQCESCSEYALEDEVMQRVDEILERADPSAELEIIRYAASRSFATALLETKQPAIGTLLPITDGLGVRGHEQPADHRRVWCEG